MWQLRTPPRHGRTYICLVQTKEMQGMEILIGLLVMVTVLRTVLTAKRRYSNTAVEFPPLGYYIVSVYRLCRTFPLTGVRARTCAHTHPCTMPQVDSERLEIVYHMQSHRH